MTSIYKPLIKILVISLVIALAIGLSVFATVKEAKATKPINSQQISEVNTKQLNKSNRPISSQYQRKLAQDIAKLMPGHQQFNSKFLWYVLATSGQAKES
ncbi:hypothetical protein LP316_12325 [Thalassotalea sp. LPB0316]|uniref:hypothetical protein n=1 Tax=Thalassotalea sp. LPB0316 TaxID=2769490 RepID=UPI00186632D3|nr:hypothetical protein [Thalassotalea sp. LPB0316]QOL25082.1 hypothetical protein LP316_12325 [Thalassotalea sp. LPB0316]